MSPSSSASGIVADTTKGHHYLTIHGYYDTKGALTGEWISSLPFAVGGHRWRINYFPNGMRTEVADYVSLSLQLYEEVATAVKIKFEICFADEEEAEQAVALESASVSAFTSRKCWEYDDFIRREHLARHRCHTQVPFRRQRGGLRLRAPMRPAPAPQRAPRERQRRCRGV